MKKRILVIDDTPILTESISEMLVMEGFEVSVAFNGEEGLAVFRQVAPDLILTDLVMPKMGGLEFIRHIRSGGICNTIPIIILTADTSEENQDKAHVAGANFILHKPFDEEFLLYTIRKLLPI